MNVVTKDYYQVLGLFRTADQVLIKSTYRHLAQIHHPDKQPDDVEKFKDITEAYRTLKDQNKRATYDRRYPLHGQPQVHADHKARHQPTGTKAERARALFRAMSGAARKTVIQAFIDQIGLSQAGASTYYSNCKKEKPK